MIVAASRAEAATLYVCVKRSSGTARFVKKRTKCKRGERRISWSTVGRAGKKGTNGTNGAPGKAGSPGAEGKAGPQGPSDVYEVELNATIAHLGAATKVTLTLPGLPPGAYAIFGKAELAPEEEGFGQSSSCELVAGTEVNRTYFPLNHMFLVGLSTELTYTFTSTGSVAMTCTAFGNSFLLSAEGTRIVAIGVSGQHKMTAAATT
ncbi:MAG: hypothetical protein ACYDA6_07920 [Solirubrobacteraceae bacterium]